MITSCLMPWVTVLSILWATAPVVIAQSNSIEPEFAKYRLYQVDRRSMPEALLNFGGFTSQDVGRSFAMIVGVSHYPKMKLEKNRYLAPADRDIDLLFTYLKDQQFFDEVVVLKDDAVTFDNLKYFLETYFPAQLKRYPKSRFLFAYSGHGMEEGRFGYLLTSNASSLTDKQHSIDMVVLREFSNQTILAAFQSLFLINACHSGAFLGHSSEGAWDVLLKRPGAHAIASSGAEDNSFGDPDRGSIFYQKFIEGLNGAADPTGKGVITVSDLGTFLNTQVGMATDGKQVPTPPQDIWSGISDGGMFFFNRQKAMKIADFPIWNPRNVSSFGGDDLSRADGLWRKGDYTSEFGLLNQLSKEGNARATAELGRLYDLAPKGVAKNEALAVKLYKQAADAGDMRGKAYLGLAYDTGKGGLSMDETQAVKLYKEASDGGDTKGEVYLGNAYLWREDYGVDFGPHGRGGTSAAAAKLFQQAADAGDPSGWTCLGSLYPEDLGAFLGIEGNAAIERRASSLLQQAADAGDPRAMRILGWDYVIKGDGLERNLSHAVSLEEKAADGGDRQAMRDLQIIYEDGTDEVPKNEARAKQLKELADKSSPTSVDGKVKDGRVACVQP